MNANDNDHHSQAYILLLQSESGAGRNDLCTPKRTLALAALQHGRLSYGLVSRREERLDITHSP